MIKSHNLDPLITKGVLQEVGHDKVFQYTEAVENAGQAALMMQIADEVGVVAELIDEPERAATAHRDAAYNIIRDHGEREIFPNEWAKTARRAVENGGALIRLTTYGNRDLTDFWEKVTQARAKEDNKG